MKTRLLGGMLILALLAVFSIVTYLLWPGARGNAHRADIDSTEVMATRLDNRTNGDQIDLTPSHKAVPSPIAGDGAPVTDKADIPSNNNSLTSSIAFSDVIPERRAYVPSPLPATSGATDDTLAPTLTWTGTLTLTPAVTIDLPLILKPGPANPDHDPLTEADWYMAGANPQRTSWVSEEVRGPLDPTWYRVIEPYISQRVQIIAAYDTLYISTARGLYTLDADTGAEGWVYPTELPLGHSPTVTDGVVYVGGFDRKLHAINAFTGEGLWTFEARAGFETNPLVVNGVVYAGNRDGTFYAVDADDGQLLWQYPTAGPIRYSAAYRDGVVFFASNDMHGYALYAEDQNADGIGDLVWKSAKLPGDSFKSWWPVVYEDRVIFSGSHAYRMSDPGPGIGNLGQLEFVELYNETDPGGTLIGALGTAPGDWAAGTPTIDAARILSYFAQKPWRKTVFVLDLATGEERETAPVLWASARSGNRYPPVVGADGVLYQQNHYLSGVIAGGHIAGWQPGVEYISAISSDYGAADEPHAAAAGGDLVYWNLCCDRQAGAIDVTLPNTRFAERYSAGIRPPTGEMDGNREWLYFSYALANQIPGYNVLWYNPRADFTQPGANYGGVNGIYGNHADVNPPIPYNGKVYMHRSNAIIAFGDPGVDPVALPMAETVPVQDGDATPLDADYLQTRLETELQKMLSAGHLRPGYMNHGLFDHRARTYGCGRDLIDYWYHPGETIYTLIMALPYLPPALEANVRDYIQNEFSAYPPYQYNHIGWRDGASREGFDTPPEVASDMANHPPETQAYGFHWDLNPFAFYALWQYAEEFGGAIAIFEAGRDRLDSPPVDEVLLRMPYVHNAFIAGYVGYLELERLAGYAESTEVRNELNRLLQLRADNFAKDTAYTTEDSYYCRPMNVSSNFMFLVPELATYLRENALEKVEAAVDEYEAVAPYWFVSFASEGYAENGVVPLYDGHALFMAKALILEEPFAELERYLDVPGFAVGDLFYIQKLVTLLTEISLAGDRTAPVINGTLHTPLLPTDADTVTVTAQISDDVTLLTTTLYYRLAGTGFLATPMAAQGENWYAGQIAPQSDGSLVEYYVSAGDDDGQITTDPSGAPASVYKYRVRYQPLFLPLVLKLG